jgi:branched-chain amino acid transport system ATP-binding protein
MILEVDNIHTYYGTSHILFGVCLSVDEAEVACLLGRNGAGKTTTIRSIMGLVPSQSGSIKFKGEEIRGRPPYFVAKRGIGYVPDYRGIFPDLTVRENLLVAEKGHGEEKWTVEKIYNLFPILRDLDNRMGGKLSGGEQQMLTIGRTLMGNPHLMLLDEPVEGIAPLIVKVLEERLRKLKEEEHLTILLSEQNVRFATKLSDKAYVIEKGVIRYHGTILELSSNEEVKHQYLAV